LAVAPDGLIVLAGGIQIRKIGADGLVHTLLTSNNLDAFVKLAIDRQSNIYYSAILGIIKLTPAGSTVRVAGIGNLSTQDGAQATAVSVSVTGMAVDPSGNVVFSDGQTMRVWRIDSSGALRAVAGTATAGTAGEGGPAVSAQLEFPQDLAYDSAGALYILDQHRILKINPEGTLVRLASG
jgi:DNA-binding beta-propeller fold protein YncE